MLTVTNNKWIKTWENCYQVSLNGIDEYKRRLKELTTWDKPTVSKDKDSLGKWEEWSCKITALKGLISELENNTLSI